jgi:hypothetical protein
MVQGHPQDNQQKIDFGRTAHAVITDLHFIVPLVVLLLGIALLVALH